MLSEGGNPLGHPCNASLQTFRDHTGHRKHTHRCAELPEDSRSFLTSHCVHGQQCHVLVPSCKNENTAVLLAPANGKDLSEWQFDISYTAAVLWAFGSLDSPFHGSHLNLRVADYLRIYLTFICA